MSDDIANNQIASEVVENKEKEEVKEVEKVEEIVIPLKTKLFTIENQSKGKIKNYILIL